MMKFADFVKYFANVSCVLYDAILIHTVEKLKAYVGIDGPSSPGNPMSRQ